MPEETLEQIARRDPSLIRFDKASRLNVDLGGKSEVSVGVPAGETLLDAILQAVAPKMKVLEFKPDALPPRIKVQFQP